MLISGTHASSIPESQEFGCFEKTNMQMIKCQTSLSQVHKLVTHQSYFPYCIDSLLHVLFLTETPVVARGQPGV